MKKEIKKCSKCGHIKTLDDFPKRPERKIGVRPECKDCFNSKIREGRAKLNPKNIIEDGYKRCSKCKDIKEVFNFGKDSNTKDNLKKYCKDCRKNESDKLKDKKRKQEWYLKNRKITINRSCNRQKEKKFERSVVLKQYYKNNSHIYFWRSLVRRTLNGRLKNKSSIELLGYNYSDLKNHIESLFTDGMSWDNYGEWHIDHIKPLSSFSENDDIKIVNALCNLQPLWATTREIGGVIYEGNLNKGNYYD